MGPGGAMANLGLLARDGMVKGELHHAPPSLPHYKIAAAPLQRRYRYNRRIPYLSFIDPTAPQPHYSPATASSPTTPPHLIYLHPLKVSVANRHAGVLGTPPYEAGCALHRCRLVWRTTRWL